MITIPIIIVPFPMGRRYCPANVAVAFQQRPPLLLLIVPALPAQLGQAGQFPNPMAAIQVSNQN